MDDGVYIDLDGAILIVESVAGWLDGLGPKAVLLSPTDGTTIVVPDVHFAAAVLRLALIPPKGSA